MKVRLLLLLALLALAFAGCGGAGEDAESVPAAWRIVRESFGHRVHVIDGDVKCTQCHEIADAGFAKPPADLCKKCHDDKVATIHEQAPAGAETPVCQDCHGFGKDLGIKPNACMRCHAKPQGDHVQMIQIHSGATCSGCHRPHERPSFQPRTCRDCHDDVAALHGDRTGATDCLDCHRPHELALEADGKCADCHAKGTPAITSAALFPGGHERCTGCHQPHQFTAATVKPCETCHQNQPVLAAKVHTSCVGCHRQHEAAEPRACTSCHREQVAHPAPSKDGACAGCHPPHQRGMAGLAVACATCHDDVPIHGSAQCRDCHVPHQGKPVLAAAMCQRCHADKVASTAHTGHATCQSCHVKAAH